LVVQTAIPGQKRLYGRFYRQSVLIPCQSNKGPTMPQIADSPPDRLLKLREAAALLSLSERTVRRMLEPDGPVPVVRVGNSVRVRLSDVEKIVRGAPDR